MNTGRSYYKSEKSLQSEKKSEIYNSNDNPDQRLAHFYSNDFEKQSRKVQIILVTIYVLGKESVYLFLICGPHLWIFTFSDWGHTDSTEVSAVSWGPPPKVCRKI